jgi:hypothetical protein
MSNPLVLKLVIGVNREMKQPWGLAEVITGEQANAYFRKFLEEYHLPEFDYDPNVTVVQITHRDTPSGRMGINHHYGLHPVSSDRTILVFDSLETNIRGPHWDIRIGDKWYVTLDTPEGLQKLKDNL